MIFDLERSNLVGCGDRDEEFFSSLVVGWQTGRKKKCWVNAESRKLKAEMNAGFWIMDIVL